MAKNKSIIKIEGTIGDLTFYTKDGKNYVKRKTEIKKDRIKNAPEYQRTRENMQEFAGAASIGKEFRKKIVEIKTMADRFMHNRLMANIRKIINSGSGNRGERVFEILANKHQLIGFEYNKTDIFSASFFVSLSVTANTDKNEATLSIPAFNASDFVIQPQGATHFKMVLNVSTLTDFNYDVNTKKYISTNVTLTEQYHTVKSAVQPVVGSTTPITLVATLPAQPVLSATEALVVSVGIEFYQEINGDFYLFSQGNAMRIQQIF